MCLLSKYRLHRKGLPHACFFLLLLMIALGLSCSYDPSRDANVTEPSSPTPFLESSPSPSLSPSPHPDTTSTPSPLPSATPTASSTPETTPSEEDLRDALCHWDELTSEPGPFPAWWHDAIFYEIFVRSYKDSDGDGIGDLAGLTEQLDYLNDGDPQTDEDLGVTGIWLMPLFDSPSEHGYDVTDYETIHPDYGTLETFKTFLEAAHERGIRVILDLPLNHSSREHPWFLDASAGDATVRDWYVWSESDQGDKWYPSGDAYYYAVFWDGMPDFNYWDDAFREQMRAIYDFWLGLGIDGFRLDGVKYLVEDEGLTENTDLTHCYLEGVRRWQAEDYPDALFLGEVWDKTAVVARYLGDGHDQLPLVFDFDLSDGILHSLQRSDVDLVSTPLLNRAYYYPDDRMGAPFLRNHDMDRTGSELGTLPLLKQALAIEFSVAGTPFIYYGEEIGMTGKRGDENNDNARRSPMQWNGELHAGFSEGTPWYPVNEDYTTINVALQREDPDSLFSWYRTLIRLRLSDDAAALRSNEFTYLAKDDRGGYAFLRGSGEGAVLVVFNVSAVELEGFQIDLKDSGSWNSGRDLIGGALLDGPIEGNLSLDLAPNETLWIRLSQDDVNE